MLGLLRRGKGNGNDKPRTTQERFFLTILTTPTLIGRERTFVFLFLIFGTVRDEVNRESGFCFRWRVSMRQTVSVLVCFFMAGFCVGLNAQIPENPRFQPGSYAVPYHRPPAAMYAVPVAADAESEDGEDADDSRTEWEKRFSPQVAEPMATEPLPPPYEVPHVTFVYNHWTGRFHIAPYEPGYAANPAAFPKQTSPLHIWTSSKSSASQLSPQVPYMSYYDPDPVILPAEIRLRGSRFSAPLTQLQPVPLPVPRPEAARPVHPSQTKFGERMRQTFGTFVVQ